MSLFERFRRKPCAPPTAGEFPKLVADKTELIDFAFTRLSARTFADLGGVWHVEGGYTFYAVDRYDAARATLVDTHPTEEVRRRLLKYPRVRLIQGDFGRRDVAREVGEVDVIFLFDVLLHQAAPDWDEVLEMYAGQTRSFLIYNPQWVGPGDSVRLLDLGEEGYFKNVPCGPEVDTYAGLFQRLDAAHPEHNKPWRDVHPIWQWGITDADLTSKLESLGFRLLYAKNCRPFGTLENFESHSFVFGK